MPRSAYLHNRDYLTVYEAAQIMDFNQRYHDGEDLVFFDNPEEAQYPPSMVKRVSDYISMIMAADGRRLVETEPEPYIVMGEHVHDRDYIYNHIRIDHFVDWLNLEGIDLPTGIMNQLIERSEPLKLDSQARKILSAEIGIQDFTNLKRAPLWELSFAILSCAGIKASNNDGVNNYCLTLYDSIYGTKLPKDLSKIQNYALQAAKIGKLQLHVTKTKAVWMYDTLISSAETTYEVEPEVFVKWLQVSGFELPMIKEKPPRGPIHIKLPALLQLSVDAYKHFWQDWNPSMPPHNSNRIMEWMQVEAKQRQIKIGTGLTNGFPRQIQEMQAIIRPDEAK